MRKDGIVFIFLFFFVFFVVLIAFQPISSGYNNLDHGCISNNGEPEKGGEFRPAA